jgi:hypothetical protein
MITIDKYKFPNLTHKLKILKYDYIRQVQVPESGSNSQTVKILKYDYNRQVQIPESNSQTKNIKV